MDRLETKTDVKVLYDEPGASYKLRLESHHRGVELAAYIQPSTKGDIISPESMKALFDKLNLSGTVDEEALKLFCAKACAGEALQDVILMTGVPPTKGLDERLEFVKLPVTDKPRYVKDELGNIDYYHLRLFDNVVSRDVIAYIRPAENGKPGRAVTGEIIPHLQGLPMQEKPKSGDGIHLMTDPQKGPFYMATAPGRVVFENNMLFITDEYIIKGDVDMTTGHVDFIGTVRISGDVKPGFNVKAGKLLKVFGNAASCELYSGEDMEVGGITSSKIYCGGALTSKYINDSDVECRGNIKVKNEIVSCNVKCSGLVTVDLGSIVGGYCKALAGIEAKIIGAEIGTKTQLIAGVCYVIEEKMQRLQTQIAPITEELERLTKRLDPIVKNPKALLALSPKDRDIVREQAKRMAELIPIQDDLKTKIDALRKEMEEKGNPMINARSRMEKGVEMTLGSVFETTVTSIPRPVSIIRHSKRSCMRYLNLYPITDKAFIIEREILRLEEEDARRKREAAMRKS